MDNNNIFKIKRFQLFEQATRDSFVRRYPKNVQLGQVNNLSTPYTSNTLTMQSLSNYFGSVRKENIIRQ